MEPEMRLAMRYRDVSKACIGIALAGPDSALAQRLRARAGRSASARRLASRPSAHRRRHRYTMNVYHNGNPHHDLGRQGGESGRWTAIAVE
jgi:hypothetical protein